MGLVSTVYSAEGASVSARKANDGQEERLEPKLIVKRWRELESLAAKANAAGDALSAAIKATAEASGFNARAIRNALHARVAGDDAAEKMRRDAEQLQIVLDVTSEFSESGNGAAER